MSEEKKLQRLVQRAWERFKKARGVDPGDTLKVEVYREILFTSSALRARAELRRGTMGAWNIPIFRGSNLLRPDGDIVKVEPPRANLTKEDWEHLGDQVYKAFYQIEEMRGRGENPPHVLRSRWDVEESLKQSQTRT